MQQLQCVCLQFLFFCCFIRVNLQSFINSGVLFSLFSSAAFSSWWREVCYLRLCCTWESVVRTLSCHLRFGVLHWIKSKFEIWLTITSIIFSSMDLSILNSRRCKSIPHIKWLSRVYELVHTRPCFILWRFWRILLQGNLKPSVEI